VLDVDGGGADGSYGGAANGGGGRHGNSGGGGSDGGVRPAVQQRWGAGGVGVPSGPHGFLFLFAIHFFAGCRKMHTTTSLPCA